MPIGPYTRFVQENGGEGRLISEGIPAILLPEKELRSGVAEKTSRGKKNTTTEYRLPWGEGDEAPP